MPMSEFTLGVFSFTEAAPRRGQHDELPAIGSLPQHFQSSYPRWSTSWELTAECRGAATAIAPPMDAIRHVTLHLLGRPADGPPPQRGDAATSMERPENPSATPLSGAYEICSVSAGRDAGSPGMHLRRTNTGALVIAYEPGEDLVRFEAYQQWRNRIHNPDVLAVPGVTGLYEFVGAQTTDALDQRGRRRHIHVFFLHAPPVQVARDIDIRREQWIRDGRMPDFGDARTLLFAGPLEAIQGRELPVFA